MTGYGTNLRHKNMLKNVKAAKYNFEHKISPQNRFADNRTILSLKIVLKQFEEDNIRPIKRSMPRTIHRQDFSHTAAEIPTN
jgi:hypothetical protein